jgi:outer membrane protein TolC
MRIARQDADFNQTLTEETQKRFDAGAAARSDVLNFQIRMAQAESRYLASANDYTNANIVLAALLGIPSAQLPADMTPATVDDDPLQVPLPVLDDEVAYALDHRPDYIRIDRTIARLQAGAEAVRGDYWPEIGLEAAYGWSRLDNPRFNDSRDASSYIGVSATWDIFTGGSTAAAYSAAKAQVRENRRLQESLHNDIVAEIARQIENTKLAKQQVELQRRIHKMTSEARELVRNEYAAGRTSLTRLNEAQTDLIRAAGNLAVATIRYWQIRETLASASGQILEIDR